MTHVVEESRTQSGCFSMTPSIGSEIPVAYCHLMNLGLCPPEICEKDTD